MIKSIRNNRSRVKDVNVIWPKKGKNKKEKPLKSNTKHESGQEQ
jgi:hypothetical protein